MPEYIIGKESEELEFKRSTGELKEGVISIASILNKHGFGRLYFGVKNDGTVVGQEISDKTTREISQAIRNHIKPVIYPEIVVENYGSLQVVCVSFEDTRRPFLAYNVPRIRIGDEDLVMDQDKYQDMLEQRNDIHQSWERRMSKYKIDDINDDIFERYIDRVQRLDRIRFENMSDRKAILNKLGLTSGNNLLNAGAALLCETDINVLNMAKFRTEARLNFDDIRKYTGSIFSLVKKAEEYIIDAMDWRVEFNGSLEREEIPEIPLEAIREALFNAFAHRVIESGQAVEVSVYKSKIEIFSPGKYASDIAPEDYAKGGDRPVHRNALISNILYYSDDMETFATGFSRIKNACERGECEAGYEKKKNGFVIIFSRRGFTLPEEAVRITDALTGDTTTKTAQGLEKNTQGSAKNTQGSAKNTQGSAKNTQGKARHIDYTELLVLNGYSGKRLKTALSICDMCEEPSSIQTIMDKIGYKNRKTVRQYISELIGLGCLEMTIPEKPNSMHQKYRRI